MPMPSDDVAGDVWFRLLASAGKARHPELALWRFVADVDVLPDRDEISEDDVPGSEREAAELRRAARSSLPRWRWWTGALTIFS